MKKILCNVLSLLCLCALLAGMVDEAHARYSSGSSRSSGSRSSSGRSSSGKSSSGFITRECKTASCYQKHPDGRYSIPLSGRKKRR